MRCFFFAALLVVPLGVGAGQLDGGVRGGGECGVRGVDVFL